MSISGYSYKDVEARLKAFADGHYVIQRYSVGEATDFDVSGDTWPLMHVVHPAITPDAGQVTYNFEVVFADLPRDFDDKTGNQVEAISDLIRLALDLLSEVKNGSVLFGEDALVTSSNIDTGAVQSFNSVCIARLTFTLVLPWDWNACDIPADYAPAGSSSSLFPIDGGCCDVEYYISKNNQPGNGFALGDVIRVSGTNTFAKARANTLANSYAVGVVTKLGGDAYNYKMGGIVTEGVPNYPAETIMYLSDSVAGGMTTTPPAIVRPVMMILDPGQRAILMLSLVNPGTGGIEGVTGNIVDNTDPQNPVVDQVQANWNESDNTDPSFIQNKPAIPTGTVESVTGESVDNTDPDNPVVNAIPLAGTGTDLVTGTIEVDGSIVDIEIIKQFSASLGGGYCAFYFGDGTLGMVLNDTVYSTDITITSSGTAIFYSNNPSTGGIQYPTDYSANFQLFSLIDLQTLKKRFWTKAGAPTTTDDDTQGFIIGSLIWDTTNSILYRATSVTTGAAAWTVAIVAGTGTVESVTDLSPSAIDNTDPDNPVTNIIPRSGTDVGFPVTGNVENNAEVEYFHEVGTKRVRLFFRDEDRIRLEYSDSSTSAISRLEATSGNAQMLCVNAGDISSIGIDASTLEMLVSSNVTGFEGLKYDTDYSANFVDRSLVDKAYVDSVTPNITSGTAPPSGGNDGDIYLQYT